MFIVYQFWWFYSLFTFIRDTVQTKSGWTW